jgi:membrane protease YdiL (CAAX protease family)
LTGAVLTDEQWERFTEGSDGLLAVARTPGEHVLSFLAQIANSFAEELVMRGYLIRRFQQLFRSTWLALLFTTVLFAGYHCYQGAFGVVNALVTGFTYGGAYCLCRRLWPVVVAHTLVNCVAEWAG